MIRGGVDLKRDLVTHQASFRRRGLEQAARDERAGFVFSCPHDVTRCARLIDVLLGHHIRVEALAAGVELDGRAYDPAWSWFVPIDQPRYLLVRSLFETVTDFADTTFYDVSTWTLPLAFGARFDAVGRDELRRGVRGAELAGALTPSGRFEPDPEAYAYLLDWRSYFAPRTLRRLLEAGFDARVAARPLAAETPDGLRDFDPGTIVLPLGDGERRAELEELLAAAARQDGVEIWGTDSGLTPDGLDLGSPRVHPLTAPRPALVVGRGVSTYEAGETWHLLDERFGFELTLLERDLLGRVDLTPYTHLLMVDGEYDRIDDRTGRRIEAWIESGGVLVATKKAAVWAESLFRQEEERDEGAPSAESSEGKAATESDPRSESPPVRRRYGDYDRDRAAELVSGAVVEVELDPTHPVAFGYQESRLPVFRDDTLKLTRPADPYTLVAVYGEEPLLSGYMSTARRAELAGGAALVVSRHGEGSVVLMADNPNFRAIWYGTSRLLLNAVFFGPVVRPTSPPSVW